jgi:uncharacterized protein YpmS
MRILRKTLKIASTTFLILLALLLIALFLIDKLVQFRDDDKQLTQFFKKKNISASIGYYQSYGELFDI